MTPSEARDDAVESHLPLRPVEFNVLLSLGTGSRHGYGIMLDSEERSGSEVIPDVGTLYRALKRMVDQALIEKAAAPPDEEDSRRVYYALTPLGRRVASAEAMRLAGLVEAARSGGFLGKSEVQP